MNTATHTFSINFPNHSGVETLLTFVKLMLLAWLAIITVVQSTQARATTLVSLTFDDGRNQSAARLLLLNHGMKGTFYVNSDRVGLGAPYLSKAELDVLYADGNEIGGHNIGHVDLATLSDAAQKTAICNDMQQLVNWGYQVRSFAYPFSSTGPTTQSIVAAGCPGVGTYESARAVGGLVNPNSCNGCPWAESLPPANRYYISTNNSIISTTTLATMQGYVLEAENHGGGWVPIVIHNICDSCGSSLSVSPATLDAFLTWLQARQAQGTYVRTIHQVMAGDYGPPPPPPPPSINLLNNPSLELDVNPVNNQADCWQRAGYGTSAFTWTRLNGGGHTPGFAESLQVTARTSGDRKLVQSQGSDTCAPVVTAGKQYVLSGWYTSNIPTGIVAYYKTSAGVWNYWQTSGNFAATSTWAQGSYTTPPVPADATALSFGFYLNNVGTLVTDDYAMFLKQ
ncbi:polysaccharide deacetylase family protein [Crenothrix polyspora]|uniref:Polysaccharide deacetylase n=1 Tax=Crenothrix polyspora TaxID=360316 RepID=A0A1R4H1V1_9GAMM